MELRNEGILSPEEREKLAYDVPQSGAAVVFNHFFLSRTRTLHITHILTFTFKKASLVTTIIITVVSTSIIVEYQIVTFQSALVLCLILWLGKYLLFVINRLIVYNSYSL